MKGGGDIPVPRPVVGHGHVYITNAHGRMAPVIAVSLAAKGELNLDAAQCEHVTWSTRNGGNYMQTPLVYGDHLYLCKDMGVLTCVDAKTGERVYRERLESGMGFTASGVAADGKLYFTSEQGGVYVIKAGPTYEVLAINELGETCMASPAIAAGTLFFRTRHHLVAIAGDPR
jgi:outer membrane protein assembly factor BamB